VRPGFLQPRCGDPAEYTSWRRRDLWRRKRRLPDQRIRHGAARTRNV